MKSKEGDGLDAIMLRLKAPGREEPLSDVSYSNYLIEQSPSCQMLGMLLSPLRKLFNEKDYGPRYKNITTTLNELLATRNLEEASSSVPATREEPPENIQGQHERMSSPNTTNIGASDLATQQKSPEQLHDASAIEHGDNISSPNSNKIAASADLSPGDTYVGVKEEDPGPNFSVKEEEPSTDEEVNKDETELFNQVEDSISP